MKQPKLIGFLIYFHLTMLFLPGCNKADKSANPAPAHSLTAGELRTDGKGIQQVWAAPDTFQMGTSEAEAAEIKALHPPAFVIGELPSEQPKHLVRLTTGYWIDKYEVTNAAFQTFVDDSGYYKQEFWSEEGKKWLHRQTVGNLPYHAGQLVPDCPRVNVTWYEAEAYATWRGGRLPTEAEWEFAARGPKSPIYPWGNTFDAAKANVVGINGVTSVGNFPDGVSWIGAQDMAGNAMEWVQDWLAVNYYKQNITDNPQGPVTGIIKIEKGGWWGSNQFAARSAYRHFEDPPTYQDHHIGFRIVSP
jgi:formylglycine-generating enzyme required for sulfatase activity